MAQAEVQDGEFLFEVRGQGHDEGGGAGLVDCGPRQGGHHLSREPVAQLGVDVVGAQHCPGELGPGVGVLVGQAGAPDHPDALARYAPHPVGHLRQGVGPARLPSSPSRRTRGWPSR